MSIDPQGGQQGEGEGEAPFRDPNHTIFDRRGIHFVLTFNREKKPREGHFIFFSNFLLV